MLHGYRCSVLFGSVVVVGFFFFFHCRGKNPFAPRCWKFHDGYRSAILLKINHNLKYVARIKLSMWTTAHELYLKSNGKLLQNYCQIHLCSNRFMLVCLIFDAHLTDIFQIGHFMSNLLKAFANVSDLLVCIWI